MSRQHQPHDVVFDDLRKRNLTHPLSHLQDARRIQHFAQRCRRGRGRKISDPAQLFTVGIMKQKLKEETVHLGLGKRIGSLHLDRILRGEHHEWIFQTMQLAADGHTLLLHRFQQSGLSLWRSAIDLVGQNDVSEDGAALKIEYPSP